MEDVKICVNCDNCIYVGEGTFICDAQDGPVVVMEDFEPADDYFICGGADWEAGDSYVE